MHDLIIIFQNKQIIPTHLHNTQIYTNITFANTIIRKRFVAPSFLLFAHVHFIMIQQYINIYINVSLKNKKY